MSTDALSPLAPPAVLPSIAQARGFPSSIQAAPAAGTEVAPSLPNPRLRLEPSLGLVVIEFRDAVSDVATSIPTRRELDAYRAHPPAESPTAVATEAMAAALTAVDVLR